MSLNEVAILIYLEYWYKSRDLLLPVVQSGGRRNHKERTPDTLQLKHRNKKIFFIHVPTILQNTASFLGLIAGICLHRTQPLIENKEKKYTLATKLLNEIKGEVLNAERENKQKERGSLNKPQTGEPKRQCSERFCPSPSHQPECR